jgi:hypothetical protein
MTELTDLLWERAQTVLFISKEEYLQQLEGWDIRPVHDSRGEIGWITVQKGPEFHFQNVGPTRLLPMRVIREFLQGVIDRHGYALTRTPLEDIRQQRFNRRFGFVEVGCDAFDIIFRIDRLPHA